MTPIHDIMTRTVQSVDPSNSLQQAARLMMQLDVGALPVTVDGRLVGMITDRDLAVRGIATDMAPSTARVEAVMSTPVTSCAPEDDVGEVMRRMGQHQLRRLPVVEAGRLVGIVALADLARRQAGHIDQVVRDVSRPGTPGVTAAQGDSGAAADSPLRRA